VKLVEDRLGEWNAFPILIGPLKTRSIDNLRRCVNALRLKSRCRIRPLNAAIKPIKISLTATGPIGHHAMISELITLHRNSKRGANTKAL